jgi:hypothetical protein
MRSPIRRQDRLRARPALESLDDRIVPSTLGFSGRSHQAALFGQAFRARQAGLALGSADGLAALAQQRLARLAASRADDAPPSNPTRPPFLLNESPPSLENPDFTRPRPGNSGSSPLAASGQLPPFTIGQTPPTREKPDFTRLSSFAWRPR